MTKNTQLECVLNTFEQPQNNYQQLLDERLSEYGQKKMEWLKMCVENQVEDTCMYKYHLYSRRLLLENGRP